MFTVEKYAQVRQPVFIDGVSRREVARLLGLSRETVTKMCRFAEPPGYRRTKTVERPKLGAFVGVIDAILEADDKAPPKQRYTAKRIWQRLRDEYGFTGGYTTVKDYVRQALTRRREVFVPLAHPPGHAQIDFCCASRRRSKIWVGMLELVRICLPDQGYRTETNLQQDCASSEARSAFTKRGSHMPIQSFAIAIVFALLAFAFHPAQAQDVAAGEKSWNKCRACHQVGETAKNTVGPKLNGLFGRTAGTVEDYKYSDANKNSGIVWDEAVFAEYIKNPRAKMPGTKMAFAGIKNDEEINNLTSFLKQFDLEGKKKQ